MIDSGQGEGWVGGGAAVVARAEEKAKSVAGCVAFAVHAGWGVQFYDGKAFAGAVGDASTLMDDNDWTTYILRESSGGEEKKEQGCESESQIVDCMSLLAAASAEADLVAALEATVEALTERTTTMAKDELIAWGREKKKRLGDEIWTRSVSALFGASLKIFRDSGTDVITCRPALPAMESLSLWLDAADAGTIDDGAARAGSCGVGVWNDKSPCGHHASAYGGAEPPTYGDGHTINGLDTVRFERGTSMQGSEGKYKTIAMVMQWASNPRACDMMFSAWQDQDFSLRFGDGMPGFRRGRADGNDWEHGHGNKLWVNGSSTDRVWEGFPDAPGIIVGVKRHGRLDEGFTYQLSSKFMNRGMDAWVGEIIGFDRELDEGEAKEVGAYLGAKWGLDMKQ